MSGVEIRQLAASEGQSSGRRGQEGWPTPLYRTSWSTGMNTKFSQQRQILLTLSTLSKIFSR